MRDKRGIDHSAEVKLTASTDGEVRYRMACTCGRIGTTYKEHTYAVSELNEHMGSLTT